MLDIGFFNQNKQPVQHVEVSEFFLLWLARTKFSEIGEDRSVEASIDDGTLVLLLVRLNDPTRQNFVNFFTEAVLDNTQHLLAQLDQTSAQSELAYKLKKLLELLDCFKNRNYAYLRRL